MIEHEVPKILSPDYWISPSINKQKHILDKKENLNNLLSLIVTSVYKNFPELINSTEKSFMNFQDEVYKILSKYKD